MHYTIRVFVRQWRPLRYATGRPTNVEYWRVLASFGESESGGGPSKLLIQHVTIKSGTPTNQKVGSSNLSRRANYHEPSTDGY